MIYWRRKDFKRMVTAELQYMVCTVPGVELKGHIDKTADKIARKAVARERFLAFGLVLGFVLYRWWLG